jgi:hypothetical protein
MKDVMRRKRSVTGKNNFKVKDGVDNSFTREVKRVLRRIESTRNKSFMHTSNDQVHSNIVNFIEQSSKLNKYSRGSLLPSKSSVQNKNFVHSISHSKTHLLLFNKRRIRNVRHTNQLIRNSYRRTKYNVKFSPKEEELAGKERLTFKLEVNSKAIKINTQTRFNALSKYNDNIF